MNAPCKYGCGAMVGRHQKVGHEKFYCTALADRTPPTRACKWRECEAIFTLKTQSPHQEYCSKRCWARAAREDDGRKLPNEERKGAKPHAAIISTEDREALQVAHIRLREAEVRLEVRRAGNALEEAREHSYALWFSLLGIMT